VILGVDTDVLVAWAMAGTVVRHTAARKLFAEHARSQGGWLGLTAQVLQEFLHVVTDARRFEQPLDMPSALRMVHALWEAKETVRILPMVETVPRTVELMARFQLGRKRILDTALAATLELAGVRRLATFNPVDFQIFPFLELVTVAV
jgi:predicted nucleic acid-binding protein